MTKQKLIFITSRFPFPLEKGDKLRAYYLIKGLSEYYNIYLIALDENVISLDQKEALSPYTKEIHDFTLNQGARIFRLFLSFFNSKPFQINYFTSRKHKKQIELLLNQIKPEHIFCQLIRPAEYVKNYHDCPKTLDYMDALSKGMERRIQKVNLFTRIAISMEAQRLKEYERRVFSYFEFQTIISAQDQNYIAHPDQKQMLVLPNGIDGTFFENLDVVQKFDFVFVGNLSYPPNIDAVNYILDNILPLYPNKTLLVAGAKPSKQIVSKISKVKNCTLLAGVKDIRTAYLQGKIFLAPMQIGTGMQNKILEAMALGIPCITSSLVNNAIQGKQKKHLWVADQIHEIKEGVDWLLADENNYKKIQEDAKVFIKNQYQWTEIIARLHKKISSK
jgi:glycosyltransferase involved in cell wall biosynthesis